MKIKSILIALLLMASTVASAQYLNVKMEDGTYRSYKVTPDTKVSLGEKAGAEIVESPHTATVNGQTVTVNLADDILANDVAVNVYVEGEVVKIKAVSALNKELMCIWNNHVETPNPDVPNGFYTFTIPDISTDMVATVEYRQPTYTVRFNLNGHGGLAPTDKIVAYGQAFTAPENPTASNFAFWCWCTDEDCTTPFDFSKGTTTDITLYAKWTDGINGHAYVELAGYKWATENVGECAGMLLCPIGGNNHVNKNDWNYYFYHQEWSNEFYQTNYPALEAARSWGSETDEDGITHSWHIPSKEQWLALINECFSTWTESYSLQTSPFYGKPGCIIYQPQTEEDKGRYSESSNGYSPATVPHIFLPAAGIYHFKTKHGEPDEIDHQGSIAYFWASELGYCFRFKRGEKGYYGSFWELDATTIRPVSE